MRSMQDRVRPRPKLARRRIQIVGVAATSAATAVWLIALAWLSPFV